MNWKIFTIGLAFLALITSSALILATVLATIRDGSIRLQSLFYIIMLVPIWIGVIGTIGYSFKKRILTVKFWRVFLGIASVVLAPVCVLMGILLFYSDIQLFVGLLIVVGVTLAAWIGLIKYAYHSDDIWSLANHELQTPA